MVEKIEEFYTKTTISLFKRIGDYYYKGANISPIMIKFYLNSIINSTELINEIQQLNSEGDIEILVEKYSDSYFEIFSIRQKISIVINEVLRYIYNRICYSIKKSQADYFIFITNKKFISYAISIKEGLKNKNKKIEYLVWDKNQIERKQESIAHLPSIGFPLFWKKDYFLNREFISLVDRAQGFTKLLYNKKLILIEGCLESQHVMGILGDQSNYETICMQWGYFGKTVTKAGWRSMPYDKFLVWGDFFKDSFANYNNIDIISCGHPTLQSNKIISKGKVILFAVQREMGEHILTSDVFKFIDFAIDFADNNSEFKVIIRSHPDFKISDSIKEKYKNIQNIIWHDYFNFSLAQSFEESKYCVSISSTVSIESIAFGCYPIYTKINNLPLQLHDVFSKNSEYGHVFDFNNFSEGIQNLETKDLTNYISVFKIKLYKALGKEAVENIVEQILN